jgi:hypothetical protein
MAALSKAEVTFGENSDKGYEPCKLEATDSWNGPPGVLLTISVPDRNPGHHLVRVRMTADRVLQLIQDLAKSLADSDNRISN